MTINMNDSHVITITQIRKFLQVSQIIEFKGVSQKEKYTWVENTLTRFRYFSLEKRDKGIVKKIMMVVPKIDLVIQPTADFTEYNNGKLDIKIQQIFSGCKVLKAVRQLLLHGFLHSDNL